MFFSSMIELRVYASLLSRRAQTFLLTVQSVLNCRDHRLLEKLPKAEFSSRRAFKNAITRHSRGKREKNISAYRKWIRLLMKRTTCLSVLTTSTTRQLRQRNVTIRQERDGKRRWETIANGFLDENLRRRGGEKEALISHEN